MIFANVFVGNTANDGTGDPLRTAFQIIDQNFANIAAAGSAVSGASSVAGRTGNVVLNVNDVAGAVSYSNLTDTLVASNVYLTSVLDSFTTEAADQIYANVAANLASTIASLATTTAETELSSFNANLTAANLQIASLNSSVGSINSDLAAQASTITGINGTLATVNSHINSLNTAEATNTIQISNTNAGLTAANSAISALQSAGYITASSLTPYTTLAQLTANVSALESAIAANISAVTSAWQANSATQETEISGLRANIIAANVVASSFASVSQLSAAIATVDSLINTTNANVAGAVSSITGLESSVTALTGNVSALQGSLASTNTTVGTLVTEVTTNQGSINTLFDLNVATQANLGTATNNITTLFGSATSQETEITGLRANITAANSAIATLNSGLTTALNDSIYASYTATTANAGVAAANVVLANTNANVSYLQFEMNNLSSYVIQVDNDQIAANALGVSLFESVSSAWQANAQAQEGNIRSLQSNVSSAFTQININTGSIDAIDTTLNTLVANVNSNTVTVTGNITGGNIIASGFYFANGEPFVSGSISTTGNITFVGDSIGTISNGNVGIYIDPYGVGKIHLDSLTGIKNPNPGAVLGVGDGAPGSVYNTGNLDIGFSDGISYRGDVSFDWEWFNGSNKGTNLTGGTHANFGLYKNGLYSTPFMVFDYATGGATVNDLTATDFFYANGQSLVSTVSNYIATTSNVALANVATYGNVVTATNNQHYYLMMGNSVTGPNKFNANSSVYFNPVTANLTVVGNVVATMGINTPALYSSQANIGSMTVLNNINTGNFAVTGNLTMISTSVQPARSAALITGDGTFAPTNNAGVMLQVVGQVGNPARVYLDGQGTSNYAAVIGRHYNGTTAFPMGLNTNDVISRIGATPYTTAGWPTISTTRVDYVADEVQTGTNQGSRLEFWITPRGNPVANIAKQMYIDTTGIHTIANVISTNVFSSTITAGAVTGVTIGNTGASLVGTITTSAQPNINSVGALTNLAVVGNLTLAGNSTITMTGNTMTRGALVVTGDASGFQSPNNAGVMVQVVGQVGTPGRVYVDGQGTGSYAAVIGRHYNGNTASPSGLNNNDMIARFGATPYTSGGWPTISTTRIDMLADENQSLTNQGSRIEFWVTPKGTTTLTKQLYIDNTGSNFVSNVNVLANVNAINVKATGNIYGGSATFVGNVTAANITLTGNTGAPTNTSTVVAWARVTVGTTAYWTPLYQ